MALVEVKNLKKYFYGPKGAVHAVDDVTMNIDAGETMGVVGESGCGKSTLGRTIIHLQKSTGGSVHFNGKDITNPTPQELKKLRSDVQIIFQDPYSSLNPRMTVEDTIKEPLLISGKCGKQNVDAETERLMDMVGIARRIKMSYPHELDGGRRQRVGIARALALDPKFIVCDEPVSALDVSIQAQVVNMFEDLQKERGLSYLFIAHDLLVVQHISDRIAVMYLGHMMELADADELMDNPIHPYTQSLLSAVPIPDPETARHSKRIVLEGDVPSPLRMPSGCPFRSRCKYATEQCAAARPELTDRGNGHMVACFNR